MLNSYDKLSGGIKKNHTEPPSCCDGRLSSSVSPDVLLVLIPHGWYPLVNIQKAIENCPVEIVDFPMKNGGSFQFVM